MRSLAGRRITGRTVGPGQRIALALAALALATLAMVAGAAGLYDALAPIDAQIVKLRDYRPPTTVEVLDRNGMPIDRFFAEERREWVKLEELPPVVPAAFIASEDRRFYSHVGVDLQSILRATVANFRAGALVEGGSTLTQQVVKNLVVGNERTFGRKAREAAGALLLEWRLSKDEILELYLNLVYLGSGAYGVQEASREYFGLDASALGPAQAATLASLVPAPSAYSPQVDPDGARARRDRVLRELAGVGAIDADTLRTELADPVRLVSPPQGPSPFGDAFRTTVRREVRRLFGGERASNLGLTVHTGFDPVVQATAERVIRDALDTLDAKRRWQLGLKKQRPIGEPPFCEGAAIVLDHTTGDVVALVGGYTDELEGFVRAVQGRRQPGSAFKPILYAAALEKGWRQTDRILDAPLALRVETGKWWTPENHQEEYLGSITLRTALAISSNTAAVRLAQDVGMEPVVAMAQRLGVETPLRSDLSVSLGSSEVTPMDLARAYATVARHGRRAEPVYISSLVDMEGNVLGQAGDTIALGSVEVRLPGGPGELVVDRAVADELTDMLVAVVERGTGRPAFREPQDRAGKTGTTTESRDAWFAGFTPQHTIVVWIGADESGPLGSSVTGAKVALPAWMEIADALGMPAEGEPPERFAPPALIPVTARRGS